MVGLMGERNCEVGSGYSHIDYSKSFFELGSSIELPNCGGALIERPIGSGSDRDAMGTYPLFFCEDWSGLPDDLASLEANSSLVSVVLVTEPFGNFEPDTLSACFKDLFKPFKRHYLINLNDVNTSSISSNHKRNAKRALKSVSIEVCPQPVQYLDDWVGLYDVLVDRHDIEGVAAFSREAFSRQMQVPGMVAFRAHYNGTTIGMLLWYQVGDVAYYHLGAHSDTGYEMRSSFALFWTAIDYFRENGLGWLDLGAGAGLSDDEDDGLTRFKKGWSNDSRLVYLCGRILDSQRYDELTQMTPTSDSGYFPAYRAGEFG